MVTEDYQHGFCRTRSTTDMEHVENQITEKSCIKTKSLKNKYCSMILSKHLIISNTLCYLVPDKTNSITKEMQQ